MAEQIEQHLRHKVTQAIEAAEASEHSLLAKIVSLRSQFKYLKELLKEKTSPSAAADPIKQNRETLYRLNNLLTEWQILVKKQPLCSRATIILAIKLHSSLKNIIKDLTVRDSSDGDSDNEPSSQPNAQVSALNNLQTYRWSCPSVDANKVRGLDHEVRSLERLLVRRPGDRFRAIGIFALDSIGKTTLCQVIFNKQEVKNGFLPRIWVCLSKKPNDDTDNEKEIVKRMLHCLGVEEEIIISVEQSHGIDGLVFALHLQLKGKRYLIVLDDAWNNANFCKKLDSCLPRDGKWGKKLAHGLPKEHGGTVIVTSRYEEVAKNMVDEENIRRLRPLSDREACWLIFKDSYSRDGKEFPSALESLKKDIVDKCAGLPLVAKMLGRIKYEQLRLKFSGDNKMPPDANSSFN